MPVAYKQPSEFSGVELKYHIESDTAYLVAPVRSDVLGIDYDAGDYTYLTLSDGVQQDETVKVVGLYGQGVKIVRGQLGTTAKRWAAGACLSSKLNNAIILESVDERIKEEVRNLFNEAVKDIACGGIELEVENCCDQETQN